uniref:Uncharacterized protein n=1 Tax=uncultured Desulfobacterium sp. TaxID=201089 RepID=E1YIX2_9BACT|nr:unknown protein [uncultured Desulfobacterium sp.]
MIKSILGKEAINSHSFNRSRFIFKRFFLVKMRYSAGYPLYSECSKMSSYCPSS